MPTSSKPSQSGDYDSAVAVTPADGTPLDPRPRALYVGGVGNLVVTTAGGGAVTFVAVQPGTLIKLRALTVEATLTTATQIIALY